MTELEELQLENARLKTILKQMDVSKFPVPFICGKAGEEDNGLPQYLDVCPVYGADVGDTVRYERIKLPWDN